MKIVNFGVLAAAIVFTGSVYADGFYAGGGVGRTNVDASTGTGSLEDTDTSWKIFAGYAFNKYFAVEGAWVDLGDFSDVLPDPIFLMPTKVNLDLDGFAVSGIGSYPVNDVFTVFGKLGVWGWESDVSIPAFGISDDDSGTDVVFGVGGSYSFTDAISVRAEWERYKAGSDDADLLSVSGVFSF